MFNLVYDHTWSSTAPSCPSIVITLVEKCGLYNMQRLTLKSHYYSCLHVVIAGTCHKHTCCKNFTNLHHYKLWLASFDKYVKAVLFKTSLNCFYITGQAILIAGWMARLMVYKLGKWFTSKWLNISGEPYPILHQILAYGLEIQPIQGVGQMV